MAGERSLVLAGAMALALPTLTGAQATAPLFSGRYKLVLTAGRGCAGLLAYGPQSVLVDVVESTVTPGSEVKGQSTTAAEKPEDTRFVLLRQGDRLHGPFGSGEFTSPDAGLRTLEGFRVWLRIIADGSATTSSGRARASGTAFGEIDLSRPVDPDVDTIGSCDALDHTWALEPA